MRYLYAVWTLKEEEHAINCLPVTGSVLRNGSSFTYLRDDNRQINPSVFKLPEDLKLYAPEDGLISRQGCDVNHDPARPSTALGACTEYSERSHTEPHIVSLPQSNT
jgi:hypothetical protein